jgi:hypothetical protein
MTLYYMNAILFMYLDSVFINNRYAVKRLIIGFKLVCPFIICNILIKGFEDVIIEENTLSAF